MAESTSTTNHRFKESRLLHPSHRNTAVNELAASRTRARTEHCSLCCEVRQSRPLSPTILCNLGHVDPLGVFAFRLLPCSKSSMDQYAPPIGQHREHVSRHATAPAAGDGARSPSHRPAKAERPVPLPSTSMSLLARLRQLHVSPCHAQCCLRCVSPQFDETSYKPQSKTIVSLHKTRV